MAALCSMARVLMLRRAMSAAWPALKMAPATSSSSLGRAGGLVEEAVLDEASIQEFCRLVADNYEKQIKVARATGMGFTGIAAVGLAWLGIDRLKNSSN